MPGVITGSHPDVLATEIQGTLRWPSLLPATPAICNRCQARLHIEKKEESLTGKGAMVRDSVQETAAEGMAACALYISGSEVVPAAK
jgi:hypothetical protein